MPRQGGKGMVLVSVPKGSARGQVVQEEPRQMHWLHVGPLSEGEQEQKEEAGP